MPEVTERECQVESVVDGLERQFGQTDSLAMHVWCEEPTQGGPMEAHAERTSIGCMDATGTKSTPRRRHHVYHGWRLCVRFVTRPALTDTPGTAREGSAELGCWIGDDG